jgi:uncharacterized protein YjiS (DUF1127 family)
MPKDRPLSHATPSPLAARRIHWLASWLWQLPSRLQAHLWQTLLVWQERATDRHRLALMGEHERKDIGITRLDAEGEINKPFWRP